MKHKLIYDPVFRSETLFYQCKDVGEAVAHAKKKYNVLLNVDGYEHYKGLKLEIECKESKMITWAVWVKGHKDWKTMMHEAAHLVFGILDESGVKYNSDNDETWCYLHEYFVKEFWHIMCKKRKKK
jgi:hypothetical protein